MNPFQTDPDTDVLVLEDIEVKESQGFESQLLIYNDDFNTFDWVIQCLVEIVGHTEQQAEQNAMLIHFKGKACVKSAPMSVLKPLKEALCDRGLSAVIETIAD